MTPRIKKLVIAFSVLLPLLLFVLLYLPSRSEVSRLEKQKASFIQAPPSKDKVLEIANKEGGTVSTEGDRIVVVASYDVLLRIARLAEESGYVPYSFSKSELQLQEE